VYRHKGPRNVKGEENTGTLWRVQEEDTWGRSIWGKEEKGKIVPREKAVWQNQGSHELDS